MLVPSTPPVPESRIRRAPGSALDGTRRLLRVEPLMSLLSFYSEEYFCGPDGISLRGALEARGP